MRNNKLLGLAVAAALSIGVASQSAQAANIATDGIGEIAYIPYYTTTGGKVTYVRLVNHSFNTLAVKLKVREGTNSRDARDFHIFLSPRDVWVGSVSEDTNGPKISTFDTSCTVPSKDRGWNDEGNGLYSVGIPAIGSTGSTEGYIVAQVMGASDGRLPTQGSGFDAVSLMQHNNQATPADCHGVSATFDLNSNLTLRDPLGLLSLKSQFTAPTNSLSAAAAIINPANSTLTDIPVTVLANVINRTGFEDADEGDIASNDTITAVASDRPDETDTDPTIAGIYNSSDFTTTSLDFGDGLLATSAALMQASVNNYIDSTGGNSWIITFPTKKFHDSGVCSAPFPSDCRPDITSIQHTVRDQGALSYVTNEEESEFTTPNSDQICFSGPDFAENCSTTTTNSISLPTEVNIVTMGSGNALNSGLTTNISTEFLGGITLGWMQMRFTDARSITAGTTTLHGLPVIGFSYTEYPIGGVTGTMTQNHTYTTPLLP